mmetsp:Transcript_10037/g.23583  ORF Transcript_10037/g.23583 Transcript_10037/m.23583 type:complete len:214 (+) Transcript_10037:280-921(+)
MARRYSPCSVPRSEPGSSYKHQPILIATKSNTPVSARWLPSASPKIFVTAYSESGRTLAPTLMGPPLPPLPPPPPAAPVCTEGSTTSLPGYMVPSPRSTDSPFMVWFVDAKITRRHRAEEAAASKTFWDPTMLFLFTSWKSASGLPWPAIWITTSTPSKAPSGSPSLRSHAMSPSRFKAAPAAAIAAPSTPGPPWHTGIGLSMPMQVWPACSK